MKRTVSKINDKTKKSKQSLQCDIRNKNIQGTYFLVNKAIKKTHIQLMQRPEIKISN